MPDNRRFGEPWPGATYNGFAGATPPAGAAGPRSGDDLHIRREPAPPPPAPPRRGMSKGLLMGGVAAAVALGLGFGLMSKPDLVGEQPKAAPMAPAERRAETALPPPAADATVPVEVAQPTPIPAPAPTGRLEVLPPELAENAGARPTPARPGTEPSAPQPRVLATAPAPPRVLAPAPPRPAETAIEAPGEPASARAPAISREPEPAFAERQPAVRPAFNCRYARSQSERMICGDAELATLDRRLNRAFNRAVDSGVPYRDLRQDQDDWLRIREDAARRAGPDGVANVYRQRIAELNDLAE